MAPVPGITPISGDKGRVRYNGDDIPWVGEWSVTITNDKTEIGPFVGDGNKYPLSSGRSTEFSIKGNIPKRGSKALRAMRRKANGRISDDFVLILETFGGDFFLYRTPFIESYQASQKGDASLEFEVSGSGVVVDGDSKQDEDDE